MPLEKQKYQSTFFGMCNNDQGKRKVAITGPVLWQCMVGCSFDFLLGNHMGLPQLIHL